MTDGTINDYLTASIGENALQLDIRRKPRALCCLLYGSSPSQQIIGNALAMAHTLIDRTCPLILMITPDVPGGLVSYLRSCSLFSEVVVVDYILADVSLFKKDWFREVFTKLHIFNMTSFAKVIFLDLDVIVTDVVRMEALFELDIAFGAMENSKGGRAASMWLKHGEHMGEHCRLINAGVILVTPSADLFRLLVDDVTSVSTSHQPGMTPEQFYLARVMGSHFHHISQEFNFEVQYHGGVPLTDTWKNAEIEDIVCLHFSGGQPLARIAQIDNSEWGCQTEKFYVRKTWDWDIDPSVKELANRRAKLAFGLWAYHYSRACQLIRARIPDASGISEWIPESAGLVHDKDRFVVMRLPSGEDLVVDSKSHRLEEVTRMTHLKRPTRPPPSLA